MAAGVEPRQLLVGPLVRRQLVVEGLVIEQLRAELPGVIAPGHAQVARQEHGAARLRALAEILEVMAVADVLRVDLHAPLGAEILDRREPLPAAILLGELVVGQEIRAQRALSRFGKQPVFGAEVDATAAEIGRGFGQILVRRDVPVPGNGKGRTAPRGAADGRVEETGLARIAQREGDPRQVQDRHALEHHFGLMADATHALGIERDAARVQLPVGGSPGAGRVADVAEFHDVGLAHRHRVRHAAAGVLQHFKLRMGEQRAIVAVIPGIAGDAHGRVLEAHGARHLQVLRARLVGEAIAVHLAAVGGDRDVAAELGVAIRLDRQVAPGPADRASRICRLVRRRGWRRGFHACGRRALRFRRARRRHHRAQQQHEIQAAAVALESIHLHGHYNGHCRSY